MSGEDSLSVMQSGSLNIQDGSAPPLPNLNLAIPELSLQSQIPRESRSKRHFTYEEDCKIRELVKIHGPKQWQLIAQQLKDRTARQVRDRYRNYLSPNIIRSEWTIEEEKKLMELTHQMGRVWSQLVRAFPGRSDVDIKNHYHKLQRHAEKIQKQPQLVDVPDLNLSKMMEDVQMVPLDQNDEQKREGPNVAL